MQYCRLCMYKGEIIFRQRFYLWFFAPRSLCVITMLPVHAKPVHTLVYDLSTSSSQHFLNNVLFSPRVQNSKTCSLDNIALELMKKIVMLFIDSPVLPFSFNFAFWLNSVLLPHCSVVLFYFFWWKRNEKISPLYNLTLVVK